MTDKRPIGVFDSGLGGLTVLKEIIRELPDESIVYFGDSGRAPYGTKSKETVTGFTFQNIRFLMTQDIKMLVIACNTASAYAYEAVKKELGIPVIEVVRPGSAAAAAVTRNGRIGVIGTPATIASKVYENAILVAGKSNMAEKATVIRGTADRGTADKATADRGTADRGTADRGTADRAAADKEFTITSKACPLFVPLVEEGRDWWTGDVVRQIAEIYLAPMRVENIDTLVLGCTHYPVLKNIISDTIGSGVTLISSALEVARETRALIEQQDTGNVLMHRTGDKPVYKFFTSDSAEKFKAFGSYILDKPLDCVEKIDIEVF